MQATPSFKVRMTKRHSSDDEEKYWDCVLSIDEILGQLRSEERDASTYRVPNNLRAIKHQAYTPQMVSIGPFHQNKPELLAMEKVKWRYMLGFVDRVIESHKFRITELNGEPGERSPQILALNKCCKVISELEEDTRAWYAEDINLDMNQLMEMLLVDGCFILELLIRCKENTQTLEEALLSVRLPFETLAGNFTMVQILRNDLMLLENQIPYAVLQRLFDLLPSLTNRFDEKCLNNVLKRYIYEFFNSVPLLNIGCIRLDFSIRNRSYNHLLDVVYDICSVGLDLLPSKGGYEPAAKVNYIYNKWGFTRCATELFQSGVQIVCDLEEIRFNEGKLFIPPIFIDKSSDTVFRNLIAFEQTSMGRHVISSYVKLMSTLICSPKDAYLLEREHIIIKSGEVEDVSSFFNSLCTEVVLVGFDYTDVCKKVNNYQIPLSRWHMLARTRGEVYMSIKYAEWKESIKDLKRDYFRDRWSLIAFLAASFVILLALVQTIYTVRSYYPPYH